MNINAVEELLSNGKEREKMKTQKYITIELVDKMAKLKDDFKIMLKDTIEDKLKNLTQEEKEILLRLYIFDNK